MPIANSNIILNKKGNYRFITAIEMKSLAAETVAVPTADCRPARP